ncbi:MAG: Nif3-like dinuclear metal center hexameric protein [Acidimicrobiia bacterium]|nr:Nif3-like dinuclear metal center hexameric protein [Acidimicrobiia bacterium]
MTTRVRELAAELGTLLALDRAAGWDAVGLQLGDPDASVNTVAVCHEITGPVADRLVADGVDLAVTYHPLLFRPVTGLVAGPGPAGRAHRLISSGVSVLVVHTAFDVMPGGAADALADALGLTDTRGHGPLWGADTMKVITFAPERAADAVAAAMAAAGAGRIGRYSACSYRSEGIGTFYPESGADPTSGEIGVLNREPETRIEMICPASRVDAVVAALVQAHPYEEPAYDLLGTKSNAGFVGRIGRLDPSRTVSDLADHVADRLGGVVRVAGSGEVSRVAVIPGSGGSFLPVPGADLVVTGDVSHHQARAATAAGCAVVDAGHAATERPGVRALYAAVAAKVEKAIDLTDLDPDPWKER